MNRNVFALTLDVLGASLKLTELANDANASVCFGKPDAKEKVQELVDYLDRILNGRDSFEATMYCLEHELEEM